MPQNALVTIANRDDMWYNVNNVVEIIVYKKEDNTMTANELLDLAITETQNLQDDEVFLVKDLFKGYEWNRISRSNRLLLGTLFLNHINTKSTRIITLEKTSSGQQKYTIKSK